MDWCILSLDVSASSTGWAIMGPSFGDYGTIQTSDKLSRSERLMLFRNELIKLIVTFRPTFIVMEDVFSGANVKTLKILAEFAGVAKETCYAFTRVDPYVISNNTVKSFFKLKKKEDLFEFMLDVLDFEKDKWNFKKDNDIIDAIAMAMCYADHVLGIKRFKEDTEYGYFYNNNW